MAAALGNAVHHPEASYTAVRETAGVSWDLDLAAYSCLVWDHSFPLTVLETSSSDSGLAYFVKMAQNGYILPWNHDYLKA